MPDITASLQNMRNYFETHATKPYEVRKKNLELLKHVMQEHEEEIYAALYADLKKSKEETYATEIGLVIAELNAMLKHLDGWMQPEDVATTLVNFPSSSKVYRDPLGVVLIISPWNYPFQLLLIPFLGALAAGNCVVIKPSEVAPATAAVIEKIIRKIYPPELVLIVQGDGAVVVPEMMNNFRFDHVFYTGSTGVGRAIYKMAADKLTPVTLELGGKSPCIVEESADITVAAKRILVGKFTNAGQTCIAPDYILADKRIKDKLVSALKTNIEKFYTTDPSTSPDYGKIISFQRFDKLVSYLGSGNIVHGGRHNRDLLYIEPTIIEEVADDAALMHEEIFGPVLPVISYESKTEALNIIKKNPNPLAFYVFTSNKKNWEEWIAEVPFGGGCINNAAWHFTNHHMPFGGIGSSGTGRYHGKYSFDVFSNLKGVMKTPTWIDPSLKYPSFKGKLKLFKWVIK